MASALFTVQPALSKPADVVALVGQAMTLRDKGDLTGALAKLDAALAVAPQPSMRRGSIQSMRANVLAQLGRAAEALPAAEESVATAPEIPQARIFLAALQLDNGRPAEAARTIVQVADLFARDINNLDQDLVASIMWSLAERKDQATRLELALALVGHDFTAGAPGVTDWLRLIAVQGLVEQGRLEEARPIARSILGTEALIRLLADRRYVALWSDLEAKAGPGLASQYSNGLQTLEAAHRAKPDDPRVISYLTNLLRSIGRAEDAAAIAAPATTDMQHVRRMGRDAFWAVNARAFALAEAGRVDEADALMASLLTLGVKEHPDLVSIAINRAATLLHYGRTKQALEAVDRAEAYGAANGYGNMWIVQVRTCALRALDRTAEADAVLAKLIDGRKSNAAAHIRALLCHDRLDDAERAVLDRLADPDERADMLAVLQDYRTNEEPTYGAALDAKLRAVRDRPSVRSAIERVGRIIPIAALDSF